MSNELAIDFGDITPIVVSVTINQERYELREATGDVACRYRNALLKCTQLGPEGKPQKIEGMADIEPFLVSMCLFKENGAAVNAAVVRAWPSHVLKKLFETAKEISKLDEDETVESLEKQKAAIEKQLAKLREGNDPNSPSGTTDGSA